jgi:hypothetical protein
MSGKEIMGTVTWPGGKPVATLHADGSWSVPGHEWQESTLKALFSDVYAGPSAGPFGPSALAALSDAVGGKADVVPKFPPGRSAVAAYLGAKLDDGPVVVY